MHMALKARRWTRADLDALPEDGKRYEIIDGALFVVAAPAIRHERILLILGDLVRPFVAEHRLGDVLAHNPVFARGDDLVQPDMIVTTTPLPLPESWDDMPTPSLVVEVLSPGTARHDRTLKRDFYRRSGVPEYWIVDGKARSITVVTSTGEHAATDRVEWTPAGCPASLEIDLGLLFTRAFGLDSQG